MNKYCFQFNPTLKANKNAHHPRKDLHIRPHLHRHQIKIKYTVLSCLFFCFRFISFPLILCCYIVCFVLTSYHHMCKSIGKLLCIV